MEAEEPVTTPTEHSSRKYQRCCLLPQRYVVAIMAALGVLTAYNIRIVLGIVLDNLVNRPNRTVANSTDTCRFNETSVDSGPPVIRRRYDWEEKSVIITRLLFFVGYFLGHIPGGYLSDTHNAKHVFGSAVLIPGIINAFVPVATEQTGSWTLMASMRFFIGFAEGMVLATLNSIISNWAPRRDRGGLTSICYSATQFSTFINNMFALSFIQRTHWTHVLYWYSGICALWWIIWNVLCYASPGQSPCISTKEEQYLQKELDGHIVYGRKDVPWCKILKSGPVWVFVFAQVAHTWAWHSLINDLPLYMNTVLRYNIKESRSSASLPYAIMGVCTILQGFLCDFLVSREYVELTTLRKIFTSIGSMGPAIFLLGATFSGCHGHTAVTMFTIAMILKSGHYSGSRPMAFDIAPNFSGIIMGLGNGLGALTAIVEPMLARKITPNATMIEWRNLFLVSLAWSMSANIIFVIFGTSQEQPWNQDYKHNSVM